MNTDNCAAQDHSARERKQGGAIVTDDVRALLEKMAERTGQFLGALCGDTLELAASPRSRIFNTYDLSRALGVHQRTILNEIYQGKLPAERIGGQWIIFRSDVVTYVGGPERFKELWPSKL